jgi:putative holliday junction resolvase
MRAAALDVGQVRIGVAISDELGALAHPRPPIDARDRRAALQALVTFASEEQIDLFLVGLPLDRDGEDGPAARKARAFASQLGQATGRAVEMFDERFSSVQATRRLREGGNSARRSRVKVDSAAACVMLQAWLDARHGSEP